MLARSSFAPLAVVLAACSSTPKPVDPPPASSAPLPVAEASASAPIADAPPPDAGLPTKCEIERDGLCLPSTDFATRVCKTVNPDVALALFVKTSPFTRGYLTREVDGWNASGGASVQGKVAFDEEVLVVRFRGAPKNGPQISGQNGSYDVLRWDGSCVTLAVEEMTTKRPPAPKAAAIAFRYLRTSMKDALLASDKVKKTYEARQKECKGVNTGDVSAKCEKLDKELSAVIVDHVRSGATLPAPEKLP